MSSDVRIFSVAVSYSVVFTVIVIAYMDKYTVYARAMTKF